MTRDEELALIIGKNINDIIESHNLNQREFAEMIGVQESTVGKWILGKASPRMGTIQKISDKFSLPKSYIMSEHKETDLSMTQKYLMDRIAKADEKKANRYKRLMELVDEEETSNW